VILRISTRVKLFFDKMRSKKITVRN